MQTVKPTASVVLASLKAAIDSEEDGSVSGSPRPR